MLKELLCFFAFITLAEPQYLYPPQQQQAPVQYVLVAPQSQPQPQPVQYVIRQSAPQTQQQQPVQYVYSPVAQPGVRYVPAYAPRPQPPKPRPILETVNVVDGEVEEPEVEKTDDQKPDSKALEELQKEQAKLEKERDELSKQKQAVDKKLEDVKKQLAKEDKAKGKKKEEEAKKKKPTKEKKPEEEKKEEEKEKEKEKPEEKEKEKEEEAPSYGAECSGGFSDSDRAKTVNAHNLFRSEIAQGIFRAKGKKMPAATDMRQLTYDCELEKSAQKVADTCVFAHSKGRNNVGENLYTASGSEDQVIGGKGVDASKAWAKEFQDYGWLNTVFTQEVFNSQVGHATQMAWAKSYKIGCGAKLCKNNKMVLIACHYKDGGNMLDANNYTPGDACSACPEGTKCDETSKLCV